MHKKLQTHCTNIDLLTDSGYGMHGGVDSVPDYSWCRWSVHNSALTVGVLDQLNWKMIGCFIKGPWKNDLNCLICRSCSVVLWVGGTPFTAICQGPSEFIIRHCIELCVIVLSGGPGLLDPCEKETVDATATLSLQQRQDITASAQVSQWDVT